MLHSAVMCDETDQTYRWLMCAFLYMSVSDYLFVDTHMVSLFFPPILQPVSFRKVTFPLIPNLIVFG